MRAAVEAEIREAFRGVTREHGVSWSETVVMDEYGGAVERERARAEDREGSWEELVDDPAWHIGAGMGGYVFLDPVGFRYYIAPGLIRCIRGELDHSLDWPLNIKDTFSREKICLFSPAQKDAVARAIRFLIALYESQEFDPESWVTAHESYWRDWRARPPLPPPPLRVLPDQNYYWAPPPIEPRRAEEDGRA